ncbi:MAG TPA: MarR family transcriptional regulator [Chloroflexota bacterium]
MSEGTPLFDAQLLGRTEKTLNAILGQLLSGSGVTEQHWVALTLAVADGGQTVRARYTGHVASALRVSEARAGAQISELAAARLIELPASEAAPVTVTSSGRQLYDRVRTATTAITQRMWGDLPVVDLEAAGRVLSTVLGRADDYLASASGEALDATQS